MRTVVQVWVPFGDRPPPSTLAEALGVAARAARAEARRSERLLALRVALLDRYPLAPAGEGEPSVWHGDTLAQERPGPSWDIEIAPAAAYEVRPYVIALAGRFGLDACDRETGELWFATGDVFSRDDRGPCVAALSAWRQGDFAAAHDALCELAQAGNATAMWHLGTLYDEGGGFVLCNALIACALFGLAIAGPGDASGTTAQRDRAAERDAASLSVAVGASRRTFDRVAFTHAYRERIGPEMSAAADELQAHLSAPGSFRAALREAGGARDAQFAVAVEALARGDAQAALHGLLPLAEQGHADAQRTTVRLWATGEARPTDPRHELDWTRVSAQAGDDAGMEGLAALLDEGVLLPRDIAQATHWLRRLVRRGRTQATRDAAGARLARLDRAVDASSPAPGGPASSPAPRPSRSMSGTPGQAGAGTADVGGRAAVRRREPQALLQLGRSLAFGYEEHRDRVAAQALFVLAHRLGALRAPFLGPDQADPRAVRHLLALIGEQGDPWALVEARQVARDDDGDDAPGAGGGGDVATRSHETQAQDRTQTRTQTHTQAQAQTQTQAQAQVQVQVQAQKQAQTHTQAQTQTHAGTLDPPSVLSTFQPPPMPFVSVIDLDDRGLHPFDEELRPSPVETIEGEHTQVPLSFDPAPSQGGQRVVFETSASLRDEQQHAALRRAALAMTGGILLAALSVLWLVSFSWPGAVVLWLLAGSCACRAGVQGARLAGDTPGQARTTAMLAFVPVAGPVLSVLLMHRASRALRLRLPPSERDSRGAAGRTRQRLRARAARAGARSGSRP